MGLDEETARGAQRFTLGHASTEADVDVLLKALPDTYGRAAQAGMAGHVSSIQTAATLARQGSVAHQGSASS
jgi:cysteine desulfurase